MQDAEVGDQTITQSATCAGISHAQNTKSRKSERVPPRGTAKDEKVKDEKASR